MNRVFQGNEEIIRKIIHSFPKESFVKPVPYSQYCIKYDSCTIIIYDSGKIMFQGKNAGIYADTFFPETTEDLPQAGSDEVGTGDFFGPICVCAAYVNREIYDQIKDQRIIDSKQLTDQQVIQIAEKIMNIVPHSLLILDNTRYNEVIADNNMNRIKARMHNQAYLNLKKKLGSLPPLVVLDDFCGMKNYYSYLTEEKEIVRKIVFETKAENKYVSVACGAIMARYAFLKTLESMSRQYGMDFPKGSGSPADQFAEEFIRKHSLAEMSKVAKINFANYRKLK